MSFDQKKRSNIEVDEMNIKSHLNTSLETEGINVSEDLINRTLEAIRNNNDEDLEVKKPPVYMSRRVRTLVTAVAALLVLAVGINAIRLNIPMGMKSDNASPEDAKEYIMDGATMDSAEEDLAIFEITEESSYEVQESDSYGTIAQDNKVDSDISIDDTAKAGAYKSDTSTESRVEVEDNRLLTSQRYMMTFTDMVSIESDSVTSITITSTVNNNEKVITNHEQIQSFYMMMDSHSYQAGDIEDTKEVYIIDIISGDIDGCITVRELDIIVELTSKDTVSRSIYTVSDHSKFIEDLKTSMSE